MSERTGFFEESPGVFSMTRLAIFMLLVLAGALVGVIGAYILRLGKDADATVVAALVGGITALVLNGIVAIVKRHPEPGGDA